VSGQQRANQHWLTTGEKTRGRSDVTAASAIRGAVRQRGGEVARCVSKALAMRVRPGGGAQ